jgi:allantoinase
VTVTSAFRDLIGYADELPKVRWPGGKSVAISVVINYEEGAERSFAFGDDVGSSFGEWSGYPSAAAGRDRSVESFFDYGARVGIWRLLRVLGGLDVRASIFACVVALQRNPAVTRALVEHGHEICYHGYFWEDNFGLSAEAEHHRLQLGRTALETLTGQAPVGCFIKNGLTDNTRELITGLGYLYDSNSYAEDAPYYVRVGSKGHLVIPYAADTNDIRFWTQPGFVDGHDYARYLKATFDQLRSESAETGKLMTVALHARISGRPARAAAVASFLEYALSTGDAWIAGRDEIAHWWLEHVPYASEPK